MKQLLILLMVCFVGMAYGQKNDTTKVLMLLCDTGKVKDFGHFIYVRGVWWEYGYEVTKTEWIDRKTVGTLMDGMPVYQLIDGHSETTHIQWLDENKKVLPITTVIWQTKPLQ